MKNLQNFLIEKQNIENQITNLNEEILEAQAVDKFGINLEPIRELQKFSSNNSTLEWVRDELLKTLNDSDIDQFLTTFS